MFLLNTATMTSQLNDYSFSDTRGHHESTIGQKARSWRNGPGYTPTLFIEKARNAKLIPG